MRDRVAALATRQRCSLIGLTEVRRCDALQWIPADLRPNWFGIRDLSEEQHDFDLCLLYDAGVLSELHKEFVVHYHASSRVRCGILVVFGLEDGAKLIVVLAHWRSDLGGHDAAAALRNAAATTLRDAVGRALQRFGFDSNVLVLGDFNAEPYDPVFSALPTSRVRHVVRRHQTKAFNDILLYNAAWRWLGERKPWTGQNEPSVAGTYYSGKRDPYSWRTFDQVLVSGSLLRSNGWVFQEDVTGILATPEYLDCDRGCPVKPFDHLPVFGSLALVTFNSEEDD